MKRLSIAAFAAFLLVALAPAAHAETLRVSATVIAASNDGDSVDPQLRPHISNLKRLFKYTAYQRRGGAQTTVEVPGKASLSIGSGGSLAVEAEPAGGNRYRLRANWNAGGQRVDTTLTVTKGHPAVLGGPSVKSGDGDLILILVVQ